MEAVVSIVIPVYNVKPYLKACVLSAKEQTYARIEILLIDDGSTDGSQLLCDSLAMKDERIVVIHKKNGGLSEARNEGIKHSKGQYLYFLDSDDMIQKDTIETLITLCEQSGADIGITEYETFAGEPPINNSGKIGTSIALDSKAAIKMMLLPGNYDHCSCGKLFKRELWKNISFPPGMLYEDLATSFDIFMKSQKVVFYSIPKYCYRIRTGSIMNSTVKTADLVLLDIADKVAGTLLEAFPEMKEIIINKQTTLYVNFLKQIMGTNPNAFFETQTRIVDFSRRNLKSSIFSKYMRFNDKVKVTTVSFSRRLFYFSYHTGMILNSFLKKKK